MKRLKHFLESVWLSSTSPAYYQELRQHTWSNSLKYWAGFSALVTLATIIPIIIVISLFDVRSFLQSAVDEVTGVYPAELEMQLASGALTINQPRPYAVAIPEKWQGWLDMAEKWEDEDTEVHVPEYESIAVFVRDEDINLRTLDEWKSIVVIGETMAVVYNAQEDEINTIDFSEMPSQTMALNRAMVDQGAEKANTELAETWLLSKFFYIPLIALLLGGFIYVGTFLGRLFQLAFFALFAWVLAKLIVSANEYKYSEVYRLSVHSMTPVLVLTMFTSTLGIIHVSGFTTFALYLGWTLFVLHSAQKTVSPVKKARPPKKVKKPAKPVKKPAKQTKKS